MSNPRQPVDVVERIGLHVVTMEPGLASALVRFHEALSAATTHNRFFTVHPHLSPEEVVRFTTVDHIQRDAIAVVDDDGEIVAVARLDRLEEPSVAEIAFVIADEWQHHGLGSALFDRLVRRAQELGVTTLIADTLASNSAMRTVFRHAGYPIRERMETGVVSVTIELAPT